MKKVLSLVLAFALVLGTFSMAFAATPSDVVGTDYEDAVERLMALGVVDGFTDGTIRPEDSITREQFAKLMVITLGMGDLVEYAKEDSLFVDVPATNWANGYINIASAKGLIKGYGDGTFGLGDEITYAQALTILVRALGYSDEGLSGKWPYNYIVKANELDITDDVAIVDGDATRGNVFMLLNNTLDCNLVEINDDGNYQNKENGDKLLSKLGTDKVKGVVTEFDKDDMEIEVKTEKGIEKLTVEEGFDFEAVFGLEITAWCDGDDVLTYTINDDVIYDAVSENGDDLDFIITDDTFEINEDAVVYINGEKQTKVTTDKVNYDVDYAKIVLNDDDEIIFFDGHNLNPFVVEKTNEDKEIVYSYGDEVKLEDYTVIDKDGNTISVEDIEDGDIMFYNKKDDYAVIYNDSVSGELERVYSLSFKIDGESYDRAGKYLDDETLKTLTEDALDAMKDEGEVEVFFNPAGDVVFVAGDLGESDTSSFYAIVTEASKSFKTRGEGYHTFDLVKEDGNDVSYDLEDAFINAKNSDDTEYVNALGIVEDNKVVAGDLVDADTEDGTDKWEDKIKDGAIVKVTVDEDGDITEVELMTQSNELTDIKETSEKYLNGSLTVNDAVVFDVQDVTDMNDIDEDDVTATTWSEFKDDYDKVEKYNIVDVDGDMAVILVKKTGRTEDLDVYIGLVTDLDKYTGKYQWDLEIEVDGETMTFVTAEDKALNSDVGKGKVEKDAIIKISVDPKTEEVTKWKVFDNSLADEKLIPNIKIADLDTANKEFNTYELVNNGVVYDKDMSEISFSDLENGDTVTLYMDENNTKYVHYIVRTAKVDDDSDSGNTSTDGEISYVNSDYSRIAVNGDLYTVNGDTKIYNNAGKFIGIGTSDMKDVLNIKEGSVLDDVKVTDGVIKSATLVYSAKVNSLSVADVTINQGEALEIVLTEVKDADNETVYGKADVSVETSSLTGYTEDVTIKDVEFKDGKATVTVLAATDTKIDAQTTTVKVTINEKSDNTDVTIKQVVSATNSEITSTDNTDGTAKIKVAVKDLANKPVASLAATKFIGNDETADKNFGEAPFGPFVDADNANGNYETTYTNADGDYQVTITVDGVEIGSETVAVSGN